MITQSRLPKRTLATSIATLLPALAFLAAVPRASADDIYWDGAAGATWDVVGNWATTLAGGTDPSAVPGINDIARFYITGLTARSVLLNGNQVAKGLAFNHTAGTAGVRSSVAGQVLSLGTSGIAYGSGQVDLGGSGTQSMVVSLTASQSWTGSGGNNLIQLNNGTTPATPTITNGTAGAVTLTFDGAGTGGKNIFGVIDDGVLLGTTAISFNGAGTLGLLGNNTYSGGTTLSQGGLNLQNNTALGTGALTFGSGTFTKTISSSLVGGITLTNNNAINLNGNGLATGAIILGGAQNIDFGTGAITLQSATFLTFSNTSQASTFTFGGALTGAFGLTIQSSTTNNIPNSLLVLNGANTGNSAAAPITINGNAPTVRFGNTSAVPVGVGTVVLNGGGIAVGSGTAFDGVTPIANFLADTRVTKTAGSIALTGDSSESFTAPAGISVGAAIGSVARYTGTITPTGAYNVGGGGGTIVFSGANTFTGARALNTNGNSNANYGAGGITVINGQNNFVGAVGIGAGTLEVSSIGSFVTGNTATSALGSPTTVGNGTITFGTSGQYFSELRYTGAGETTNRTLNFNGFSGASVGLDASGSGAVNFGGAYTSANNSTNRFLSLRGINTGANTFTAGIGTQVLQPGGINLTKVQRGNWTLTGTNNFAGTNASTSGIQVNGGTLTADYTTNPNILGATGTNLTLGGGTLAMIYSGAGSATQSIGNGPVVVGPPAQGPLTTLTANTGQSTISVTGNGTAGSAVLTIGSNFTRNGGAFLNFNLVGGGQVASTAAVTNSVVVGTGTVAAFTVTDASGADFATIATGQIAKLGAITPLETTGGANANNRLLTGAQTQAGSVALNTLRISPAASGTTLALGAFGFTTGLSAVSILKDSAFDYTITGSASLAAGTNIPVVLSNFGTGALNVGVSTASGTGSLTKTGSGLVDFTVAQTYTGATNVFGGVLRVSSTIGTGNIALNTGGIYEIGTATTFSRQLGTAASQVQWGNGDGGFSAFGGNRTVNLTNFQGVAGGPLAWGTTTGNNATVVANSTNNLFVRDGQALLLSSSTATGTLIFQNAIDLVNMPRAIVVGDGSAAVDARLTGVLSSSDFSGGIEKSGAGTLEITGANTYTGTTRILGGTLVAATPGSLPGYNVAGTVLAKSGTTLGVNAGGAGQFADTDIQTVLSNATLESGSAIGIDTTGGNFSYGLGIAGNIGLTKLGTNVLTLSGTNSYTGVTSVNNGTLLLPTTTTLPTGYLNPGQTVVRSGGTLAVKVSGVGEWVAADIDALLTSNPFLAGSALGIDTSSGSFTYGTSIGGVIGLQKLGANTLTLPTANTYDGVTTITTGILAISDSAALGSTVGNTVINVTGSVATHGRLSLSGGITTAENFTLQGSGLAANEGTIRATAGVNTLNGTVTLTGTNGYRFQADGAGTVLNFGPIVKPVAGGVQIYVSTGGGATVNFNGPVDNNAAGFFAHGTTVGLNATGNDIGAVAVQYSGTLRLGVSDALVPAQNLVVGLATAQLANGGDVGIANLAGTNQTVNALNGFASTGTAAPVTSRRITNSVAATTSTLTVGFANGTGTFDGVIENGAGLVNVEKVGTGTQTFTGQQNYNQLTTTAGITNVNASFTAGTATVNANAETNFGVSQTLAALNIGAGAVVTLTATPPPFAPLAGAVVPEPGSAALLAGGVVTLLGLRRRRTGPIL